MSKKRTWILPRLIGASALAITLALVGCGQTAAPEAEKTTEETTEAAAEKTTIEASDVAAGEVTFPQEMVRAAGPFKEKAESADTATNVDATELPEYEGDDGEELEAKDQKTVEEDTDDSVKASSGWRYVSNGGMKVAFPNNWPMTSGAGYDLNVISSDGSVYGYLFANPKQAGFVYDTSTMPAEAVMTLRNEGFTNMQVINYGSLYTNGGRLCDAYMQVLADCEGKTYVVYYEYLESRSYINGLMLMSEYVDWKRNNDDLTTIVDSVMFASGEEL